LNKLSAQKQKATNGTTISRKSLSQPSKTKTQIQKTKQKH
jgi:hypothetical protein